MKLRMLFLVAGLALAAGSLNGQQAQVYKPGNGVSSPTLVKDIKADYTAEAMRAKIQGAVLLTAVVREDGTVGDISVARSLDTKYGLDAAAVKAAKQWTFKPGMKDGKPVPVFVTIELAFTLGRRK